MFFITSDIAVAEKWQAMHAAAEGLPPGMQVREIKEHPHEATYAYHVPHEGDVVDYNKPWAQAIINEGSWNGYEPTPPDAEVETLPEEWYLGSTAPVSSLTDKEEFFRSSPGVTSINGLTGDVVLDSVGAGGKTAWNADELVPNPPAESLSEITDFISSEGEIDGYKVQPGNFVHFPSWPSGEVTYLLAEYPADTEENWRSVDGVKDGIDVSTNIGNLKNSYPPGTPIETILRDMLTTVVHPNYRGPSFSLTGPNGSGGQEGGTIKVEAGTVVDGVLRATWNRRDGGSIRLHDGGENNDLNAFTIDGQSVFDTNDPQNETGGMLTQVDGGVEYPNGYDNPASSIPDSEALNYDPTAARWHSPNRIVAEKSFASVIDDGDTTYSAQAKHEQGITKENNLGNLDTTGRVRRGSRSDTVRYRGQRKFFLAMSQTEVFNGIENLDPVQARQLLMSNMGNTHAKTEMPVPPSGVKYPLVVEPQIAQLILAYPASMGKATFYYQNAPLVFPPQGDFQMQITGADGNKPMLYQMYRMGVENVTNNSIEYEYKLP